MKVSKTFFGKDNSLNKGYEAETSFAEPKDSFFKKKFEHILPPMDVLIEYENIYPGTLAQIINMSEKEQKHRHDIENKIIESEKAKIELLSKSSILLVFFLCLLALVLVSFLSHNMLVGLSANIVVLVIIGILTLNYSKVKFKDFKQNNPRPHFNKKRFKQFNKKN